MIQNEKMGIISGKMYNLRQMVNIKHTLKDGIPREKQKKEKTFKDEKLAS